MGLLQNITNSVFGKKSNPEISDKDKQALLRKCYFEVMEQRRVLSADPVIAAVTYLEGDGGQDTEPDHFEVSFEGGSEATQLTQFTINGDQDSSGDLTDGDMFFDHDPNQPGTSDYHPFTFDSVNSRGITADDVRSFSVSENGLVLSVEVDNFEAGDIFAFSIDVDEQERFRVDKIASGVEFEGTFFQATFADENHTFVDRTVEVETTIDDGFVQQQFEGVFFDEYNNLFGEAGSITGDQVDLTLDNAEGNRNRTAGAIDAYDLIPKPITISGTIYHDEDLDCVHEEGEDGLGGVTVELQKLNEAGVYETVASTTTDANGNYEFGEDLNLTPGTYQLVETQPEGFLDVGARAGSEGGTVEETLNGDANVITNITIPLGGTAATDYDFKEVRPAQLSGHVWHDENNDGVFDPNEQGIANVLIQVTRVSAKPGVTADPFAGSEPITVRTDANGFYEVDALPPGIYEIVEINEYPEGEVNPLAPFIDGKDSTGTIDGVTVGTRSNDRFSQIELCAGHEGVNYDFGEVLPAQIGGTVWHDENNDGIIDPGEDRIGGVVIELFDKEGNKLAETVTDANGDYEFTDLVSGEYLIRQTQPGTFIDGIDSIGDIDGVTTGDIPANDEFCVKLEPGDSGNNYDFGELRPASISGTVHADANGDCLFNPADGDTPLSGVQLALLDDSGNLLATTVTDDNGNYSFDGLPPGTYSVREITPDGFLDGAERVGEVGGISSGLLGEDLISGIELGSGQAAVNYDFCEHIPAQLSGTVYHDRDDNGVQNGNDEGIEGVRLVLTDAQGNVVRETFTNSAGEYEFLDLIPGTYNVIEFQPDTFNDGQDAVGNVDGLTVGTQSNDQFTQITLNGGDEGVEYNFGELRTATISGIVHVDHNGNCVLDPVEGERALANVTLELLNAEGTVIGTTTTDENGRYEFTDLVPGEYSIREQQPEGLFSAGEVVGDGGGEASSTGQSKAARRTVVLDGQGRHLLNYNPGLDFGAHPEEVLEDCQTLFGD